MNDDEQINTELQLAAEEPLAQSKRPPFACDVCGQGFRNMNAVRMHKVRVHSEAGRQGALKGARNAAKSRSREEHLAKRREYQKKLRERYKLQGRDSRGYPRVTPGTVKWSPQQRARFNRTVKRKAAEKLQHRGNKQIRYVYPEPETQPVKQSTKTHELNYCPQCGQHLQAYQVLIAGLNEQ